MTNHDDTGAATVLVACLCASWCTSCRDYRATFDHAAAKHPDCRFLWIDIEDRAALLDQVDVENFPTLLIGSGDRLVFFGPVAPHADVLARLIARRGEADTMQDPARDVLDLLRRLKEAEP